MGYYINPEGETKEQFLTNYGELLDEAPEKNFDGINVAVCLVQNSGFSAAAISYDQGELDYFKKGFANGTDLRPHKWYMIPVRLVIKSMAGKEIQ